MIIPLRAQPILHMSGSGKGRKPLDNACFDQIVESSAEVARVYGVVKVEVSG